ncbi:c-type cytochrome [Polymorphobacter sp.]|uniref:c-type cytochrome n=1 Tax=Polymorphobacter sp. TaxID=1909290 RepID=UPI003F722D7A
MRNKLKLLATAAVMAGVAASGQLQAQMAELTTWSGVYTEEQATRGATAYSQSCAVCHGVSLGGTGEAPPVVGPEFIANWNGQSLGDLFERIHKTMPFNAPGSLSTATNADILAHVLKVNGFPAGDTELARRAEMLMGITVQAQRPAGVGAAAAPTPAASAPVTPSTAAAPAPRARGEMAAVPAALLAPPTGANAPNSQANPYRRDLSFFKLPAGRTMGSTSGVAVDSKGNIWIADRCGVNSCADSDLDPIMMFDSEGNFVRAIGRGMFLFPHGFYIDAQDNIWVTDARAADGKGGQIVKFSPDGKVLLTLGKAGVSAEAEDSFLEACAVAVARDGTIFVADGHSAGKPSRIMLFTPEGKFIKQWGQRGANPGEIEVAHAIALDSKQQVYVGDRWNNRVQIFDRNGKTLASWLQFGRPSGVFIDENDMLYVADSESRSPVGYGYNPAFKRGIRVGSVKDGVVRAFIPDLEPNPDSGATSGAEGIWADGKGVIYGAQVKERVVARYTR